MATSLVFVFSLCLLLSVVLSKPVAQDSKSSQSADSVNKVLLRILKRDPVSVVKQDSAVQSLDSVSSPVVSPGLVDSVERSGRVKRESIIVTRCPDDMIRFMERCMTFESYEKLVKEEDEE